jgi:hypothetical protein
MELKVELADEEGRYEPGETMAGRVECVSGEPSPENEIRVEVGWRASGAGSEEREIERCVELGGEGSRGPWAFSVELPAGPCSYEGELFEIEWWVRARPAGAEAGGGESEVGIVVGVNRAPAKLGEARSLPNRVGEGGEVEPVWREVDWRDLAVGVGIVALPVVAGLIALIGDGPSWVMTLFGTSLMPCLMVGTAFFLRAFQGVSVAHVLEGPTLELEPQVGAPGERIEARVELASRWPGLTVGPVDVRLMVLEEVSLPAESDGGAVRGRYLIDRDGAKLGDSWGLPYRETQKCATDLEVPESAPPGKREGRHRIRWEVRTFIRPEGWRLWMGDREIEVVSPDRYQGEAGSSVDASW